MSLETQVDNKTPPTFIFHTDEDQAVPAENALCVYDQVLDTGKEFGLRLGGLKALSSLRLEKAYRDYGHDMDNMDSLLEVNEKTNEEPMRKSMREDQ